MNYKQNFSRIYTRLILIVLTIIIFVIISFNVLTASFIKTKQNIAIAQMIPGWSRQYKPIMHDELNPTAVAFGASWVRDAFDPILSENLTGFLFFNHGVSGATSYESKRFVQSAIKNSSIKHAYLNLESFYDSPESAKTKHMFVENNLLVKSNGERNRFVALHRFKNLYTSGASINYNFRLIKARIKINKGQTIKTISPSYQSINWDAHRDKLNNINEKIFYPGGINVIKQNVKVPKFNNLIETVKILCEKQIKVHIYETPHHVLFKGCNKKFNHSLLVLKRLELLNAQCRKNLSYHSFLYPNAITLDGINNIKKTSKFYRPDGHPTPYVGVEILKKIHGIKKEKGYTLIDFGTNLMDLSFDEAKSWIRRRKGRCEGVWHEGDTETLNIDKQKLRK